MNKKEFLSILEEVLGSFTRQERSEILYDYEEHFAVGLENGKTEEELVAELGDPKTIAKQYKVTQTIEKAQKNPSAKNIFNAVFAGVGLGFFNLLFVLGPFMGIVGVLIGFFAASVGITIGGIGVILATLLYRIFPEYINLANISPFAFLFLGIGTIAFGLLFIIFNCYITKCTYKITIKYLHWNLNFIKNQGAARNV